MKPSTRRLLIGLDIGGSKTAAVWQDEPESDAADRRKTAPGANLQTSGARTVAELVAGLVGSIRAESGAVCPTFVVAGVAGAGRPEDRRTLEASFEQLALDDTSLRVLSDADIAIEGAFGGDSGAVIIAGTGSVAFAVDRDGARLRAGGWGPILGDPGSGTAIATAALRAVASAFDEQRSDELTDLVERRLGIGNPADLVRAVRGPAQELARFAADFVEAAARAEEPARTIVSDQIERLARECSGIMTPGVEPRFVLMGGLSRHAWFAERLTDALHSRRPDWCRMEPRESPEAGALRIARSLDPS